MKHHGVKGFTLIELLAVILIMTILLALTVGVTRYATARASRVHTLATMDIVLGAMQAYYEDTNAWPVSLAAVVDNTAGKRVLANLDSETWNKDDKTTIKDAYGNALVYDESGGLGGCPVLISAGPDGFFGKDSERPPGLSEDDWEHLKREYKDNNIRSDKR